ncbi:MAG: hypothetical protein WDO70_09535 [Alphaproteobacteria bacterium]
MMPELQRLEERRKALCREAENTAFSYYIRKGRVPPVLTEIIMIVSSMETLEQYAAKYSPDQPRVPAGNPDGG